MSAPHTDGASALKADEALARLRAGNARFVAGKSTTPSLESQLLDDQAVGQQPYATILGCSDSRVPPELIFDAWLGELFVIRVAGNVLGPTIAGTLQYATRHLSTPLFVVMGHERCGAVDAAVSYRYDGVRQAQRIETLLEEILPALDGIDPHGPRHEVVKAAVEANVRRTVATIAASPEGQVQVARGVKVVGAIYDLHNGRVRFLDEPKPGA